MKFPVPLITLLFICVTSTAQKFDFKINAGANLALLPDFKNTILIVDGFVVPNVISVDNAKRPPVVMTPTSEVKPGAGFNVEGEVGRKFNDKWKLSIALGVMQIRYKYDTYLPQSFYKSDFYLSSISADYGKSKFTYLSSRPFNVTRTFNRFAIQGGPIVNYLINKKYSNTVVVYDGVTNEAFGAYFEEKGDIQKFLYGANLNARFAIIKPLELTLGAQYFFNSLYEQLGTDKPLYDKSKALTVQLGLSYNLVSLWRK